MQTTVLAAALLCVGANGAALLTEQSTAFDAQGYYHARQDQRRCVHPLCGGYWIRAVNQRYTTCANGMLETECYVAEVVSDSPFNFEGPWQLLKGEHTSKVWDNWGVLGSFKLETAHKQASEVEGTGSFVAVKDNGVRCVTHPCPSMTEIFLNWHFSRSISDITFSEDLDAEMVAWARENIFTGHEVVVAGRHRYVSGPAGYGLGLVVNQIYQPATLCAEGYSWHKEACRTSFGCAHPELELTAAGGAPMVDPVTGEVTGTFYQSCVKSCDPPAFASGPGKCYVALP